MNTTGATKTRNRRRRILALAAGVGVLGLGATATFAAWTDSEWIFGGNGADAVGVATSTFEVEQSIDGATWVQEEAAPGNEVTFSPNALALTPGDATYSGVALRTTSDSITGTLALNPALAATAAQVTGVNDTDDLLFDALLVRVATVELQPGDPIPTCEAATFADVAYTTSGVAAALSSTGLAAETLDAESGDVQYYCFEVSLPSPLVPAGAATVDDYMGRAVSPMWEFFGQS
ncbi:putative ribosomally synthesized peptide with SipW-like signal peptide [Microbacterium halimionae]|uniref:Putative ribosomally synthesized peptide with SipW-like signal peptide n=1 Tax=Microbacterium halimionae TaxID=1526413 RepID=A0A7W3JMM8_9MICO|nr:SipW-dependent-type signal peptide-containing protein [Microbacterium halimionae]MBA8815676.1 putative ribosomally synthesized peptide with SipW-like signal peptide [Microbacterium halimionae]NII95722.1 putative ribosomally synthesized peptide with SipW-like signal peptide [Microbacterium halimionae]